MALRKKKAAEPAGTVASPPGVVITPGSLPLAPETTEVATTADNPPKSASAPADGDDVINWTASEFIAHQKSAGWYLSLALGAIIAAALVYLLTKDKISTAVVLLGAFVLGFYGARKPRQLEYHLDSRGVKIGQKYYSYSGFRSFAVVPEGAFSSIIFMPLKRFAPLTTIYYAPADEEQIVRLLSSILPVQEYRHDVVDQLMKRIRY
jgi:hypothetical protein